MSASAASPPAAAVGPPPPGEAIFRDDGPVARAVGGAAARVPVPGMALLLAGVAALIAVAAATGEDASAGVVAAVIAWLVLTVGATSGRWPRASFHWAVPPLVRLAEYGTIVWIGAVADALPAAYALLGVLAFRHYDLVYRRRHRGEAPPAWLNAVTAGWEGRLVIAWLLLALDLLPAAMFVWAALLAVVSLAETVAAWRTFERGARPAEYEDPEDEAG
jgi:hypothetical protein